MKIKHIIYIIIFASFSNNTFSQGISGVTAIVTEDNVELQYNLGFIYQFGITTIWTSDNGDQGTCNSLCDLNKALDDIDIKPGRYCVQIIIEDYIDNGFETNGQEEPCDFEIMTVTECFDVLLEEFTNPIALGPDLATLITPWLNIPGIPPSCDPVSDLDADGFLEDLPSMYVKNHSNMTERRFHLSNESDLNEFTIAWEGGSTLDKLLDDNGLSAQGNDNPVSIFSELFLIENGGRFYDPSYGTAITSSVSEWETNTFDGYGLGITDLPLTIQTSVPMIQTIQYLHWIHKSENNNIQNVTIE